MSDLATPPVNASPERAAPAAPRRTAVDPFIQLLNLRLDDEGSSGRADTAGLNGWLGRSDGAGPSPLASGPLLTFTLIRLLERLLDAQSPAAAKAASTLPPTSEKPQGSPVAGRLSQGYHDRHRGIDLAVPIGTPIRSTMAGRVVYAGWNHEGYGNLVIVENGRYRTYYAHLDSIPVNQGQTVAAGDVIGLSGNTGNSTGPHLHYEVRVDGQPVDPDPSH